MIKTRITTTRINQRYVAAVLKSSFQYEKDKCFLLYDMDRADIVEKLLSIKGSILHGSNPCIELWFLLHTCNHAAEISASQCVEQLQGICKGYEKISFAFCCLSLFRVVSTSPPWGI
jgi:hypothetical protein